MPLRAVAKMSGGAFSPEMADAVVTLANVQALVDDEEQLERTIDVGSGEQTLDAVLEQYYLPDLFMHRWDLAKASSGPPLLFSPVMYTVPKK